MEDHTYTHQKVTEAASFR